MMLPRFMYTGALCMVTGTTTFPNLLLIKLSCRVCSYDCGIGHALGPVSVCRSFPHIPAHVSLTQPRSWLSRCMKVIRMYLPKLLSTKPHLASSDPAIAGNEGIVSRRPALRQLPDCPSLRALSHRLRQSCLRACEHAYIIPVGK